MNWGGIEFMVDVWKRNAAQAEREFWDGRGELREGIPVDLWRAAGDD
ncbi:MAG: hypothetical protein WBB99_19485 [Rhodococcus sp. (in: high G+C Gram-positive bacteria)]